MRNLSFWESWSAAGFKDTVDAVKKNDIVYCTFQQDASIDTIKDTVKMRKAKSIVQKVQAEHEILIRQEILRR